VAVPGNCDAVGSGRRVTRGAPRPPRRLRTMLVMRVRGGRRARAGCWATCPDVVIAEERVATRLTASVAREHLLEAVVVADRGEDRRVGGQAPRRQRRAVRAPGLRTNSAARCGHRREDAVCRAMYRLPPLAPVAMHPASEAAKERAQPGSSSSKRNAGGRSTRAGCEQASRGRSGAKALRPPVAGERLHGRSPFGPRR